MLSFSSVRPCGALECTGVAHCRGLCSKHYWRWYREQDGVKTSHSARQRAYYLAHRDTIRAQSSADYRDNRVERSAQRRRYNVLHREYLKEYYKKSRNRRIARQYGTTEQVIAELMQRETCQLCERPLAGRRRAIDHDHEVGGIRGMLCGNCNAGLGLLGENSGVLRRAADYIDGHRAAKK